ncbi:MAG: sensor histidine kinase [Nodosilinea sp.]|jgi:signal transduction histidine kinase
MYAIQKKQQQLGDAFTPTLSVQTQRQDHGVKISIRDNGMGIPSEHQSKIFEPFFTTKPTSDGTGLGLSMTHDIIVGQHKGTLDVKTEPGSYTEFVITLPTNP